MQKTIIVNNREKEGDRRRQNIAITFENRRFLQRRQLEVKIEKSAVVPRFPDNYSRKSVDERRRWLEQKTHQDLSLFKPIAYDTRLTAKNVENCIGFTQFPMGIAGPLLVNGRHANGSFYIPMATVQGTLVDAYHRGALICTMAGGVNSVAYKDGVHLSPTFVFKNLHASLQFVVWVREHEDEIRLAAESTSRYAKLVRITPFLLGRRAVLNLLFKTGDASGLNMINIAADKACRMIVRGAGAERYFLRSNFSSDKKVSFFNIQAGYGKEVLTEVTLSKQLIRRFMRTTAEDMFAFWYQACLASMQAGMVGGGNAHVANALAAIYLATGQDVAQIVNASTALLMMEVLPSGDLRVYCKFPQLIVGTVGGGISLPFQRAALELMGCYGDGKVLKLAEIIAAIALAGEVSICGALSSGEFVAADLALRKREK